MTGTKVSPGGFVFISVNKYTPPRGDYSHPHAPPLMPLPLSVYYSVNNNSMPVKSAPDKRSSTSHRLAIVEGSLRKVKSMVDQGADCISIVHQSRAIQQALKKFDEQVLAEHLKSCVARDIAGGNPDKAMKDLMEVLGRI